MPLGRGRHAAYAPHAYTPDEYCPKVSTTLCGILRHDHEVVQRSDGLVKVQDLVLVSGLSSPEIWKALRNSHKHGRLRFEIAEHEQYGDWARAVERHSVPVRPNLLWMNPYICLDLQPPRQEDRVGATDHALHQLVRMASTGERDASVGWAITWDGHDPPPDPRRMRVEPIAVPRPRSPRSPRAALAAFAVSPQAPAGTVRATFLSTAFHGHWSSFAGLEFESEPGIYIRGPWRADVDEAERAAAAAALRYFAAQPPQPSEPAPPVDL